MSEKLTPRPESFSKNSLLCEAFPGQFLQTGNPILTFLLILPLPLKNLLPSHILHSLRVYFICCLSPPAGVSAALCIYWRANGRGVTLSKRRNGLCKVPAGVAIRVGAAVFLGCQACYQGRCFDTSNNTAILYVRPHLPIPAAVLLPLPPILLCGNLPATAAVLTGRHHLI